MWARLRQRVARILRRKLVTAPLLFIVLGLGRIEGRTIAIEYRWAHGRADRLSELALPAARRSGDRIVGAK
jgi:hypothetical protein